MSFYADIYIIKKTRSKQAGWHFLNHFLPFRENSAVEFEVPQYAEEPLMVFQVAEDLMDYLEKQPTVPYGLYWQNIDPTALNRHGMLFYTKDGYLIFGISRYAVSIEDTSNEEACLAEMKAYFKTKEGYITYECPPEDDYEHFMQVVQSVP